MRLAIFAALMLTACDLQNVTPDGGALDAGGSDAGNGMGALSGALAFPVNGVFETHVIDTTTNNVIGYGFVMVEHSLTCAQQEALDGGRIPVPFRVVSGFVFGTDGQAPLAGTYQIVTQAAAGAATLSWAQQFDDGGVSGPFSALDGTIDLTSAGQAAVAGSFTATVPDANGLGTPLQGTFQGAFCP